MIDAAKYKKILEEEKRRLVGELNSIGEKIPGAGSDWQATEGAVDPETADPIDVADTETEFTTHMALEQPLEKRLHSVEEALARMSNGTYGLCTIGGADHPIESARLDANPAAKTCINHLDHEM